MAGLLIFLERILGIMSMSSGEQKEKAQHQCKNEKNNKQGHKTKCSSIKYG